MMKSMQVVLRITLAAMVGTVCLLLSETAIRLKSGSLTTGAEARVGRPLTPMSYAGVARRTTRRAVAVGAAAAPVVVVTPQCVQAVDVYGRVYTRC